MPATINTNAVSRRNFIKLSGISGTALCLGFYFSAGRDAVMGASYRLFDPDDIFLEDRPGDHS